MSSKWVFLVGLVVIGLLAYWLLTSKEGERAAKALKRVREQEPQQKSPVSEAA